MTKSNFLGLSGKCLYLFRMRPWPFCKRFYYCTVDYLVCSTLHNPGIFILPQDPPFCLVISDPSRMTAINNCSNEYATMRWATWHHINNRCRLFFLLQSAFDCSDAVIVLLSAPSSIFPPHRRNRRIRWLWMRRGSRRKRNMVVGDDDKRHIFARDSEYSCNSCFAFERSLLPTIQWMYLKQWLVELGDFVMMRKTKWLPSTFMVLNSWFHLPTAINKACVACAYGTCLSGG